MAPYSWVPSMSKSIFCIRSGNTHTLGGRTHITLLNSLYISSLSDRFEVLNPSIRRFNESGWKQKNVIGLWNHQNVKGMDERNNLQGSQRNKISKCSRTTKRTGKNGTNENYNTNRIMVPNRNIHPEGQETTRSRTVIQEKLVQLLLFYND